MRERAMGLASSPRRAVADPCRAAKYTPGSMALKDKAEHRSSHDAIKCLAHASQPSKRRKRQTREDVV